MWDGIGPSVAEWGVESSVLPSILSHPTPHPPNIEHADVILEINDTASGFETSNESEVRLEVSVEE